MQAIWKIDITHVGKGLSVRFPLHHEILCVQTQNDSDFDTRICLWVKNLVVEERQMVEREISIYPTGDEYEEIKGEYIGTIQLHTRGLVFHIFAGDPELELNGEYIYRDE